jgi:hypothetical protein
LAERLPRGHAERFRVCGYLCSQLLLKQLADLSPGKVHRRKHHVIRRFVPQLYDKFA